MRPGCVDVVVVGYKSGEDLECLIYDLSLMSTRPHRLFVFDNTGNPKTLTRAWNDLGMAGTSEFVAFLNTDIRISPDWDNRLARCLEERAEVGVAIGQPLGHDWPIFLDPPGKPYSTPSTAPAPTRECMTRASAKFAEDGTVYHFADCLAAFYAVMVKREYWMSLKGYDERFRFYGQDHDLQRRLKADGLKTVRVRSCPIWHRCYGSTMKAHGEVDFTNEMRHCDAMRTQVMGGVIPPWHKLSDREIAEVRANPLYNQIPRIARRV